jgi:ATP-binding cassette subfamily B protein
MPSLSQALDLDILRKVFRFARPYKKVFLLTVALTLVLAALAPLRPWLTQVTLDRHVAAFDAPGLVRMVILIGAVLLVQSAVQFYHYWLANRLGQDVVKDLRGALYRHLLGFPLPYFDRTPIGTLVTREVSDMETVADLFAEGLIVIIGDLVQLVVIVAVMFATDWRLTLVSLAAVPFLVAATYVFKNRIRDTFQEVRTQVARLNAFVQERLTGMRVVQLFNREADSLRRFGEINRLHRKAHIRSVWYYSIFFPVVEILSALSIGLLVWWGARGVLESTVTFGLVVAFIMYVNLLFRPIRELADKFNTLQMGMVGAGRIFDILDRPHGTRNTGRRDAAGLRGHIAFENVWFAYRDEDWVLRDVSFEVPPGSLAAVVGGTGAGKTTLINLLNRFYDVSKGRILLDGVDIREYDLPSLRRQVGTVQQDVFLFSDTVAANVTLDDPAVGPERIRAAAARIGADAFIESLPGGYGAHVRERGGALSAGQRQLIAFMRVDVLNPRILVLDEATSSIDSESEELIIRATRAITRGRTAFVIAHRLATVQRADTLFVMDRGRIAESGNHDALLRKNGLYKQLYEIQFRRMAAGPA